MTQPDSKEKILVTGARGRLGKALTEALRERHGRLSVIASDLLSDYPSPDGPYRGLNVNDRTSLFAFIQDEKITTVYHLAAELVQSAERSPGKAWETNLNGLVNVLDAGKLYGCRIFWPGSIAVFGKETPKTNCPQDTITKPTTIYGMSKLAGEHRAAYYSDQFGVDVRSIRLPGLVVPGAVSRGGMMDLIYGSVQQALRHQPYTCYLKPDIRLAALSVTDAVSAILRLMDAPRSAVTPGLAYNIQAVDFSPLELEETLRSMLPDFKMSYQLDQRQVLAEQWPASFDDSLARKHWGYHLESDLKELIWAVIQAFSHPGQ